MRGKKRWIILLVVLALLAVLFVPVRFAVREYRYQRHLTETAERIFCNPEHIPTAADIMCDLIGQALEAEDLVEIRENLLSVYIWAVDLEESLRNIRVFVNLYESEHGILPASGAGETQMLPEVQLDRLCMYLRPYLTGEMELPDADFCQILRDVQTDLRWLQGVWKDAFAGMDPGPDRAFAEGYAALFEAPEWQGFLQCVSQQN